jgi:hypothetical protein
VTFVPYVPPPQSPRVRELSERLADVIEDFEREYPMSAPEIRQAMNNVLAQKKGGQGAALGLMVGLGTLVLLGGVFAYFFIGRESGGALPARIPMVAVAVAVLAILVAVLAVIKGREV